VQETRELARAEALLGLLLEAPDEQHLAEELAQEIFGNCALLFDLGHLPFESMLRPMSLVGEWRNLVQELPEEWADARLRLTIEDEGDCDRAATVLAPLNPGRRGKQIRFYTARRGAGPSPSHVERLLRRLDAERVTGELELVGAGEAAPEPVAHRETLAATWDAAAQALPPDWSDLYAEVEFVSSDSLDRAALLMAPVNPALVKADARAKPARPDGGAASGALGVKPGFRFRVARQFGYGASADMTRRCLERVDDEDIRGELRILRVLSDTDPVHTQGPVWYVEGRAV
jgi:hypothetical protein